MKYFNDPKYFGTEIVFRSFSKPHFLFADTLPDTKLSYRYSKPLSPGLHLAPYCEEFRVGHSRMCHSSCRVDCVIVSFDKFWQDIYIALCIRGCKVFEMSITDRTVSTFHDSTYLVGISANFKLNALFT